MELTIRIEEMKNSSNLKSKELFCIFREYNNTLCPLALCDSRHDVAVFFVNLEELDIEEDICVLMQSGATIKWLTKDDFFLECFHERRYRVKKAIEKYSKKTSIEEVL